MKINNIFCIGRNYVKHAKELGNEVPNKPIIFTKPNNSVIYSQGQQIHYPKDEGEIHYEIEIVLKITEAPKEKEFLVDDIVGEMALGIDLTKRDLQSKLKDKGHPWLLAKGFRHATILTDFWDFPGVDKCKERDFSLKKNKKLVQKGNISSLIFPFDYLLHYLKDHFSLQKGDIIFTGTPEGVGPIASGDEFEMFWGDQLKGNFYTEFL